MARHVRQMWNPADESGMLSRRDRAAGWYLAHVPDEIGTDLPVVGAAAQRAAENALATLARADERIGARGAYLSHLLIRSESISSSWIEGNRVTPKRLAVAEMLQTGSDTAMAVMANVRATEGAIARLADPDRPITAADIEDLQHVIAPDLPRGLRTEQNWVGGTGWSPLRAAFVPPPHSEVPRLVEDLAAFLTATDGNPVVRAAIAHAQFETIHPFTDGNGRTGRALIHTVLRRADALRNILVPVSTVFAGDTDSYIAGLTAFRAEPQQLDDWITGFARAAQLAAINAVRMVGDLDALDAACAEGLTAHRASIGMTPAKPRSDAVVLRVLRSLAAEPVLTVDTVAKRHAVTGAAAHRAIAELADAGIVVRAKARNGRTVCWTADRHLALVSLTERSNRIGGEDTRNRRPANGPPRPDPDLYGMLRPRSAQTPDDTPVDPLLDQDNGWADPPVSGRSR